MITCNARIEFSNEEQARIVQQSLLPERELGWRSSIFLDAKKNYLMIKIKSKDVSALRASLNSYLRLIGMIKNLGV